MKMRGEVPEGSVQRPCRVLAVKMLGEVPEGSGADTL